MQEGLGGDGIIPEESSSHRKAASVPVTHRQVALVPVTHRQVASVPVTHRQVASVPVTHRKVDSVPVTHRKVASVPVPHFFPFLCVFGQTTSSSANLFFQLKLILKP